MSFSKMKDRSVNGFCLCVGTSESGSIQEGMKKGGNITYSCIKMKKMSPVETIPRRRGKG
jgi:hypothetical protein